MNFKGLIIYKKGFSANLKLTANLPLLPSIPPAAFLDSIGKKRLQ